MAGQSVSFKTQDAPTCASKPTPQLTALSTNTSQQA